MNEPRISVVSGTYNRIELLQRMIASVRADMGDVPYEIVLVDGGSTDGTLKWARAQQDIVLIEQGKLLGPICAYNAGFAAAHGEYVLVMNDDFLLEEGSMPVALRYLDSNPDVGQVAFHHRYQRRRATHAPPVVDWFDGYVYGQCCLIRRWLGDAAGWWGAYTAYGGDTELSMRLWEMGWEVVPLPQCVVTDFEHPDDLRKRNNVTDMHGLRPDSTRFVAKWRGRLPKPTDWRALGGPLLQSKAASRTLRTLRYKIVPPGMPMRIGMARGFARYGPSRCVDQTRLIRTYGQDGFQRAVLRHVAAFCPDLVLFQAQGAGTILPATIDRLHEQCPRLFLVNFDGDWHDPLPPAVLDVAQHVDLHLCVSTSVADRLRAQGVERVAYWPLSWEPEFINVRRALDDTSPDVVFLGNNYGDRFNGGEFRRNVVKALAERFKLDLYGGGWEGTGLQSKGDTRDERELNARICAHAKLILSVPNVLPDGNAPSYISDRQFKAMASGAPVLTYGDGAPYGFVDFVNVLQFDSVAEAVAKVYWAQAHPDEAERIGAAGRALMRERHSWDNRVMELLAMLDIRGHR